MSLSNQQQHALGMALSGESIFLTGAAGVGKSYTLKFIVKELKRKWGAEHVFITASTGTAALAIGGTTVHSFAGMGLGTAPADELVKKMKRGPRKNWLNCHVLIVDEVSMISCEFFNKLDFVARCMKNDHNTPFGGIQLILCGDFFQLPPVPEKNATTQFAFQSTSWKAAVNHTIELTTVFRQSDMDFVTFLNQVRRGVIPKNLQEQLKDCFSLQQEEGRPNIEWTKLYPRKAQVSNENNMRLFALECKDHIYHAVDDGDDAFLNQLVKNCPAEGTITLREGAQVILLKNLDVANGLVNGSRGVVVDFDTEGLPVVEFDNAVKTIELQEFSMEVCGEIKAKRIQIPLALAWALSVHKSQGMSIDKLYVDLNGVFEYGQAYVALSRARTLKGLKLAPFNTRAIKAHPKVVEFYQNIVALH